MHALSLKPISTVAIPGTVDLPITQNILRTGALMLTAILRMIKPAPLLALAVPTMKLSSAHKRRHPPLAAVNLRACTRQSEPLWCFSVHVRMEKSKINLNTCLCTCDAITS